MRKTALMSAVLWVIFFTSLLPVIADEPLHAGVEKWDRLPFSGSVNATGQQPGISQAPRMDVSRIGSPLPFIGSGEPVRSAPAAISNVGWKLQIMPMQVNLPSIPDSVVGFHHWTDMQGPGRIDRWNQWGSRLLHMVYANLQTLPGSQSMMTDNFSIYVRSDGVILLKIPNGGSSPNLDALKKSVEALTGRPELAFPTALQTDTVFINGHLGYGPDLSGGHDVWGRKIAKLQPGWGDRFSW